MINDDLNRLKEQHIKNYKNMTLQMIKNNNDSLFEDDIKSLFRKPPLDSMDLINVRLINLAKNNKIVLNSESVNIKLDNYRNQIFKLLNNINKERLNFYNDIVNKFDFYNEKNEVLKILKKDTNNINKTLKKKIKDGILSSIEKNINNNFNEFFFEDTEKSVVDIIFDDLNKYLNSTYIKQIIENIDIKFLVKDTILINSFKEEGNMYLYTCNNSHLFD